MDSATAHRNDIQPIQPIAWRALSDWRMMDSRNNKLLVALFRMAESRSTNLDLQRSIKFSQSLFHIDVLGYNKGWRMVSYENSVNRNL